jgi:Fe-S cluster biogenesis protein NfuA
LLPPQIASDIIKRMNPYLRPLNSTMEFIWLDKNILYVQIQGNCACDKKKFFECSCQESGKLKETIKMLLKEDLDFIKDVIFIKGY